MTTLPVKSSITTFPEKTKAGAPAVVAGFAFSGAGEIAKVDVSDDDGASWNAAALGKDHDRFAWRLWSHTFTPRAAGKVRLLARATDSRGGRLLDLRTPGARYPEVYLALHGAHQADNAACALAAAEAFFGAPLAPDVVELALGSVRVPGRIGGGALRG